MDRPEVISERFPHMVEAVFHDQDLARDAATALAAKGGLSNDQIDLVEPNDPQRAAKLEPGSSSIFHTILRSHAALGVVGGVVGLILAGVLVGAGFDFAQTRPGWVFGIVGVVGVVIGMLGAGLISVRPDHEPAIAQAKDASKHGEWTVVAHARDEDEKHRADELLKEYSGQVRESL